MQSKCYLNANNCFVDFEKDVINGERLEKYSLNLHLIVIVRGLNYHYLSKRLICKYHSTEETILSI
jgi:hypothetical protein